jgi:hypothetical protein
MNQAQTTTRKKQTLPLLFGIVLVISFFLPWVSWNETRISGYQFPSGHFFKTSESQFNLGNPFPQYDFTLLVFWLIPALIIAGIFFWLSNKKYRLPAGLAALLSLSLVTVFILFSRTLIDLGVGKNLFSMLTPWIWVQTIAAVGLIVTALSQYNWLKKAVWVLTGPVFAFVGFMLVENFLKNETFANTSSIKADYTLTATELLKEFTGADSAANKKYLNKTIALQGNVSAIDILADSTSTVKFEDSTGSYIILSFEKNEFNKIQKIKKGDPVSIKGVCSGSIYSQILGTTSVNFKRTTFN